MMNTLVVSITIAVVIFIVYLILCNYMTRRDKETFVEKIKINAGWYKHSDKDVAIYIAPNGPEQKQLNMGEYCVYIQSGNNYGTRGKVILTVTDTDNFVWNSEDYCRIDDPLYFKDTTGCKKLLDPSGYTFYENSAEGPKTISFYLNNNCT